MCSWLSFSQEMRIGLIRTLKIRTISIEAHEGSYSIYGDSTFIGKLGAAKFQLHDQGVKFQQGGTVHVFSKVVIVQDKSNSALMVKSVTPASKVHYFRDNLEITRESNAQLGVVNLVDMNNYLAGVIESEGGGGRHVEYYKVQALMSRTYALKNEQRHRKEGFSLCDGVHCQAYHNMLRHTPKIAVAVKETSGEVLVDQQNELVTTYFSANCGGQTCDASYIWNTSVPYLETFRDTFCIHTRQSTWTKSVGKYAWKKFLEDEYGVSEKKYGDLIYNFNQSQRRAFYIHPSLGVPLRDLRKKFRLKSTYFSTHLEGENVVLSGNGFGHGVGLCQEGAMNMAKAGYSYDQIALFYFSRVRIIDYFRSQFFSQKEELHDSE
jgi:stage II sporulation protein D